MTTVPATVPERIPLPPAATPAFDAGGGVSFGDIVGILKRRMIMVILLWMLFGAMAVGAFILVYYKFPTYRAEAWVECISNRPHEAGLLVQEAMITDEHDRFINSQAALMRNPEILNEVLKTPEVRATAWFQETPEVERFLELEATMGSAPIRNTNYIRVSMGCRVPADPARIVEQVVLRYYSLVQGRAKDEFREMLAEQQNDIARLNDQINEKIKQIREFIATLPPGADVDRSGIVYEELRVLSEQVAALELQSADLEGLSAIYNNPEGPGVSVEDRQRVETHPLIRMLDNRLFEMRQQVKALMNDFGAEHRQVREMRNQMAVLATQLNERRDEELQKVLDFRGEEIRTAFLNSQHALMLAREKKDEAAAAQGDLDRKRSELGTLKDDLEFLKVQRDKADSFIRSIDRVVRDKQTIKVSIAKHAQPPIKRSAPHLVWLPAGIIGALALAAALAFLIEFTDKSVRTPQDIVRHLSVALLGVVPDIDDEEVPIERVETAVLDAPHSMVAEAFRTIRTNLQFSAPADRQRTLIVTSPKPEDGKTCIACNLAAAIAQGGRRVLLVDANFRRPALREIFACQGQTGLSNMLIGEIDLDSAISKTDIANLDVLAAGPVPPNPAERLASPQLEEFLSVVGTRYDQVIIDAPPLLLATDATVLATKVDGVILVCRAKENTRGIVQRACDLLLGVNAHIFGAVLNAAQTRRGGYFREQMTMYYDYQPEEMLAQASKPALTSKGDASQDDEDLEDAPDKGAT